MTSVEDVCVKQQAVLDKFFDLLGHFSFDKAKEFLVSENKYFGYSFIPKYFKTWEFNVFKNSLKFIKRTLFRDSITTSELEP